MERAQVTVTGADGKPQAPIAVYADSVFDAARQVVVTGPRDRPIPSDAVITVSLDGRAWRVTAGRIREWSQQVLRAAVEADLSPPQRRSVGHEIGAALTRRSRRRR